MNKPFRYRLNLFAPLMAFSIAVCCHGQPALAAAGTTGAIQGTVVDAAGKAPLANVTVTARSSSAKATVTTNASGFYQIQSLVPDTYTVTFSRAGYDAHEVSGVTVFQDQVYALDQSLRTANLKEIGRVVSRSAANLVQPGQTADVYNLSTTQFQAAQGGDYLHKTLYQYLQSVPGVTILGAGGTPRIRGGNLTDVSYELDGIPINDRLTGLFTTNLSNLGVNSVELYTGGYNARYGHATQGIVNSTIKQGTYPGFSTFSAGIQGPTYNHALTLETGYATPDNKYSYYVGFDGVGSINQFAHGEYSYPLIALFGDDSIAPAVYTRDIIGNFHYRPNQKNDFQFLIQNGLGRFDFNYLLPGNHPMQIVPCAGYQSANYVVTVPGTSVTGQPCVDTSGTLTGPNGQPSSPSNPAPTGLQFIPVNPNDADTYFHYSGIGKIQWNHTFSDKLFGSLRLAENFNQYIFQQPYDTPNFDNSVKRGDVALGQGNDTGSEDFYGDRRSHIYQASLDLNYVANARSTWYGGLSYEHDRDLQAYYDREGEYNPKASAFNANGTFPFNHILVNYPLDLPSAYIGTRQTIGKFNVEPSIRYDHQDYRIQPGSYGQSAWSPRLAFSYSMNPSTVIRGSYGVTSTFVPAAYFYNASPNGTDAGFRNEDPYAPGAYVSPELNHNVDLSLEKQFADNQTSLRVTPYYHTTSNKLAYYRNFVVQPDGTIKFTGPSLPKTGGAAKNFGIELGLNHLEQGTNALSWFLSGTYENSLSSSQSLGAINNFTDVAGFLTNHTLYHVAGNPPLSLSLTMDLKRNRWHFDPYFLYQCCAYYNVAGNTSYGLLDASGAPVIDPITGNKARATDKTVHQGPGYFWGQVSLAYDLTRKGDGKGTRIGFLVQNITDILTGPSPATNLYYGRSNHIGQFYGGYPGVQYLQPGVVPYTLYDFTPDSQGARTYELFLTTHF